MQKLTMNSMLLNLTGRTIHVQPAQEVPPLVIPALKKHLKVIKVGRKVGSLVGKYPVFSITEVQIQELPPIKDDFFYIVLQEIAALFPERTDFLVPFKYLSSDKSDIWCQALSFYTPTRRCKV